MRILYVTQIIPYPPHGGVLQRGYNLLRELGRHHEVHLLAFHHPDELRGADAVERSRVELGKFCRSVEYFELWPKKSRWHTALALGAGIVYPRPFSVLAQKNARLSARVAEYCSQSLVDIVHLDTIALAPLRESCGGMPVVLAHHNIESQLMARRAEHESGWAARTYVDVQARRLTEYEREQAARFPLNITVSQADSATLRAICPQARCTEVPNGVDTEYFTPRPAADAPTMIYTGGMNMFANRDAVEWFLASVWPLIRAEVPEARFLAVGQSPSARVLAAAQADSHVEVPGFVDDVRPWVARAAVYVMPLRVGGGTRLKMVDAMAQGKAIVATRLGAEGIAGDDGVHFRLADDAEAFARTVVQVLRDPAQRLRLGAAARARAESHYAWPGLAARLVAGYEQVLQGGAR